MKKHDVKKQNLSGYCSYTAYFFLCLMFFCLHVVAFSQSLDETEENAVAIRVTSPRFARGFPLFPANDIPFFFIEYEYQQRKIAMYITPLTDFRSENWRSYDCETLAMTEIRRTAEDRENPLFLHIQTEEYEVYIRNQPYSFSLCTIATAFVDAFDFFLAEFPQSHDAMVHAFTHNAFSGLPEFPAVLRISP